VKTPIPFLLSIALFSTSAVIAQVSNTGTAGVRPAAPDTTAGPVELTKPITPAETTRILGPLADGTPGPPVPPLVLPVFKVKSTDIRRDYVVQPPPMPGLPPVRGIVTTTVQVVQDPHIPNPPPPPSASPVPDQSAMARPALQRGNGVTRQTASISATVYDHSRTYLRCYPNGEPEKEICCWSNLDFNHFSGLGAYQAEGTDGQITQYSFFMSIGNENSQRIGDRMATAGSTTHAPESPELPDLATEGPAFVVTEGNTSDNNAMEVLESLHQLYDVEGARMKAAYHARIKADADRRAYLLAHPPVPKDVTIRVWKRDTPPPKNTGAANRPVNQGGAR